MWLFPLIALACTGGDAPVVEPEVPVVVEALEPPKVEPPERVTLAAVGDLVPHQSVLGTGRELGWSVVFEDMAPLATEADVAFVNLETPVAPDTGAWNTGHRNIVFNAPADVLPALAGAGFDVVALANNHVYDQGVAGMLETQRRVTEAGMTPVGAGTTPAEARQAHVVTVRGVRVAFLATMDISNKQRTWVPSQTHRRGGEDFDPPPEEGFAFVAGPSCFTDCGVFRPAIFHPADEPMLFAAIKAARQQADFVVLSFHWGVQYETTPRPEYPPLAERLIDAGVDVILGHHAHVVQPIATHTAPDGREGVIAYSLGNFVSNMASEYRLGHRDSNGNTRDGMLLQLSFVKGPGDERSVEDVRVVPLWTDSQRGGRPGGPRVAVSPHEALVARTPTEQQPAVQQLLTRRRQVMTDIVGEQWMAKPEGVAKSE